MEYEGDYRKDRRVSIAFLFFRFLRDTKFHGTIVYNLFRRVNSTFFNFFCLEYSFCKGRRCNEVIRDSWASIRNYGTVSDYFIS